MNRTELQYMNKKRVPVNNQVNANVQEPWKTVKGQGLQHIVSNHLNTSLQPMNVNRRTATMPGAEANEIDGSPNHLKTDSKITEALSPDESNTRCGSPYPFKESRYGSMTKKNKSFLK